MGLSHPSHLSLSLRHLYIFIPDPRTAGRIHTSGPDVVSAWPGSRKEVFQPHLPVRLPCYDLAPVIRFTLGRSSRLRTSGTPDSHGLTGGVYKARERIHRAMADARLLANPASRSRVADSDPNWEGLSGIRYMSPCRFPLYPPL